MSQGEHVLSRVTVHVYKYMQIQDAEEVSGFKSYLVGGENVQFSLSRVRVDKRGKLDLLWCEFGDVQGLMQRAQSQQLGSVHAQVLIVLLLQDRHRGLHDNKWLW